MEFVSRRQHVTLFLPRSVDTGERSIYFNTRSRRRSLAATDLRTTKSLEPTRTFRGSSLEDGSFFSRRPRKTGSLKVKLSLKLALFDKLIGRKRNAGGGVLAGLGFTEGWL